MNLQTLALRSVDATKVGSFSELIQYIVRPDWQNGPWVAGGCIRRLLMGQDPFESDIDVFFASETQKDKWLATMRLQFPTAKLVSNDFNVTITLEDGMKIQAVHIDYYASPDAVIDSFDYTICQLITDGSTLAVGEFTLWDLGRKRLAVHRLQFPVASMRRMIKYTQQGFYACPGMMQDFLKRVVQFPDTINANVPKYID